MKLVVQRVSEAAVTVAGKRVGEIQRGMVVFVGVGQGDTESTCDRMIEKLIHLRIFADDDDKMNRSLIENGGSLLLISQFTLYADCRKGRRPAFTNAAAPKEAKELYQAFVQRCQDRGLVVASGIFAANMQVALVNDGPVTIVLDSQELQRGDRAGC